MKTGVTPTLCATGASQSAQLKYVVMSIQYSPPGNMAAQTSNTAQLSYVEYGSEVSTGSSNDISSSFQNSVGLSIDFDDIETSAGAEFSATASTTNSSSIILSSTESYLSTIYGSGYTDGLNHGEDVFVLWINPQLNVASYQPGRPGNGWSVTPVAGKYFLEYVTVSQLQDPSIMPPGTKKALDARGLTSDDYTAILALNQFTAKPSATIESINADKRYKLLKYIPYTPPANPADANNCTQYTISNSETTTNSFEGTASYEVSFYDAVGITGIDGFTETSSFEWTNSQYNSISNSSLTSSSVWISGPSYGYDGPTTVALWWDTVYQSFLFELVDEIIVTVQPPNLKIGRLKSGFKGTKWKDQKPEHNQCT